MIKRRCAGLLLVLLPWGAVAPLASQEPRVRQMPFLDGTPLVERLLPDDEVVVLFRELDFVIFDPPATLKTAVRYAVESSDAVILFRASGVTPRIDEKGTSIRTAVTGTVERTFKSSAGLSVMSGDPLAIDLPNGEIQIGNVIVRTLPWDRFAPGQSYLLFLRRSQPENVVYPMRTPLQVADDTLVSTQDRPVPGDNVDPLAGVALNVVVREIQSVVK